MSLTELECYSKTVEELELILKNLNEQNDELRTQLEKNNAERKQINSNTTANRVGLEIVLKELQRRDDIINSHHVFDDVRHLDGFDLLSEHELIIISTKMDRQDYRQYKRPRWIDLEMICKSVIEMKKRYPTWQLLNLCKEGQYDTMPPGNFYKYEYKDEHDCYFNIGGIKVIY